MPFPEIERVKYKNNPLDNVLCQLRFPPILMIDSVVPSNFQQRIREQFPIYNEKVEIEQEINAQFNLSNQNEIINPISKVTTTKNHEFVSADGIWTINLTRTFIAISTSKYVTWEDFIGKFKNPIEALIDIYEPAFFTRIGLRYVDIISRDDLKLGGCPWNELIQPYFLGLLASEIHNKVGEFTSIAEIKCDDDESIARIVSSLVKKVSNGEQCFAIDSDLYTMGRTEIGKEQEKLEYLHKRASRLIRYAITDKLHYQMEPEKI